MHRWLTVNLLGFLLAALAACDDGTPVERGFRSRQVLSLRDSTLSLGHAWESSWLYRIGQNYWLLDLETGESREVGPEMPPFSSPSNPEGRYVCEFTEPDSAYTITDTQTGAKTVIERPAWTACPTNADPTIRVWRWEPGGSLTLWTGLFDQIAPVPLNDLIVTRVMSIVALQGTDDTAFMVSGSRPSQPDRIGMFSVALRDASVATVIPPTLGTAAWANGATGSPGDGSLASTSLSARSAFERAGPGRYIYERAMKDGDITTFVGPFSDGPSELALIRQSASAIIYRLEAVRFGGSPTFPIWWHRDPGMDSDSFATWNDNLRRFHSCRSPFPDRSEEPRVYLHPSGEELAFKVKNDTPFHGGPLLMMGAETCTVLADADVTAFGFSPDGTATTWLVQPLVGDATLWTGGPDGSAPRVIGAGAIAGPPKQPFFVGRSNLLLYLLKDLAWIDVHDDPVRLHYVAERVFGDPFGFGTDWLITGYDHSSQDGNGTLGLVQFRTGAKRPISREVVSYGITYQAQVIDLSGDYSLRVVYIVRGRNPSAQDGIWVATINSTDLD